MDSQSHGRVLTIFDLVVINATDLCNLAFPAMVYFLFLNGLIGRERYDGLKFFVSVTKPQTTRKSAVTHPFK